MNIRPWSDWLLVKFDPPAKRSSIIEIAGDNDTSAVRTGIVLRAGPGKPGSAGVAPMEVKEGDHIAFLRWHDEHRPGKAVSAALAEIGHELGVNVMMIRQTDVLFAFDGDVVIDIP